MSAARSVAAVALLALGAACRSAAPGTPDAAAPTERAPRERPWTALFDGATLAGWTVTPFGGEGEVSVVGGVLRLDFGSPLTGVTWNGPFPRTDYELELVAKRLAGTDFFCGLTFPVGAEHLTLVLGGWGGAVVGLSCIDGEDAASNETRLVRGFERGRPYLVAVRVTGTRVEAFLDGERVVDVDTAGRDLSLRPEVLASVPLGIASYATRAEIADVRYRMLAR